MRVNKADNTNFTHKIILDIGASNPKGSLKIRVMTDDGSKDIFEKKTYVQNTSDGFKSSEDFVNKLKGHIKDAHKEAREIIAKDKTASPDEKKLSGVGIFVAGTTIGDKVSFMPNLKDKSGKSLENIDFSSYKEELKNSDVKKTLIDVNKDKFDLVVTKDLGGAGLALAKILKEKGKLKEGDYVIGIMTGGGYGDVEIKVRGGVVNVETNECSSNLAYDKANAKMEKLGRLGVSVKSHINRYMMELGMGEYATDVVRAGDAQIVTDNSMKVPYYENKILNTLNADPRFAILNFDVEENTWGLVAKSPEFKEKMRKARISAVNDYAETIAQFGVNKINENVNKIYLVGPLAQGLNRHVEEHSGDYGAKSLAHLIEQKVDALIAEVDLPSTKRLKELYNFEVVCDPEINFKNNTYAGDVLMNKELSFTPNRGGWMNIPLSAL